MTGRGFRRLFFLAAAALAVMLGAFGYLIVDAQRAARADADRRFNDRAIISASLIDAVFGSSAQGGREQSAQRFGSGDVDQATLETVARRSQLAYAKVVDDRGRLLAATRSTPADARATPLRPETRAAALAGRDALSDALPMRGSTAAVFEWALPFPAEGGTRRIQVNAVRVDLIGAFLGDVLRRLPRSNRYDAVVLDGAGTVLGSAQRRVPIGRPLGDRDLLGAVREGARGDLDRDGEDGRFTTAPVPSSTWRVALAIDHATLYSASNGSRRTSQWVLFAAFALAGLFGLAMLRRVAATTAELERREENRRNAVTLNDDVLQRLVLARYQLDRDPDRAQTELGASIRAVQELVARLLGDDVAPGDLRRERAARAASQPEREQDPAAP